MNVDDHTLAQAATNSIDCRVQSIPNDRSRCFPAVLDWPCNRGSQYSVMCIAGHSAAAMAPLALAGRITIGK